VEGSRRSFPVMMSSDGGPGVDFRQVESDGTFHARADIADRAVPALAEDALDLRLRKLADRTPVSRRGWGGFKGRHWILLSCIPDGVDWKHHGTRLVVRQQAVELVSQRLYKPLVSRAGHEAQSAIRQLICRGGIG
jgi:hypothetical protein